MKIEVLTLFPEIYPGPLGSSVIGRAINKGILALKAVDLRDYTHDKRGTVDDSPYGGGPGMLMKIEPLAEALDDLQAPGKRIILLGPRGRRFDQKIARELAAEQELLLVCGHYEGLDERVRKLFPCEELSIGDYVLTSGNLAAMVVIDAVTRLLPGALGCDESGEDESFSENLLEYPQYTRPAEFRGLRVPEDLSIAGYDGSRITQMTHPRIATVVQDSLMMGRQAALYLIDRIENPRTAGSETGLIPTRLLPGESIGPVPGR